MDVAIAGAGLAGAYAYAYLTTHDLAEEITVYDAGEQRSPCGIRPCAWGVTRDFARLLSRVGLEWEDYVLQAIEHVTFNGKTLPAELYTIDKPKLIKDLLDGASIYTDTIQPGAYNRILDATGVARAYLPPIEDDLQAATFQGRIEYAVLDPSTATLRFGRNGYAWIFPLSDTAAHVGAGVIDGNPRRFLDETGLAEEDTIRKVCGWCTEPLRLSSPPYCKPFLVQHTPYGCPVVGVGEAIGCVSPLTGEGIVPGMRSVEILGECWRKVFTEYESRICTEFHWMFRERQIVDARLQGKTLSIGDWESLRSNARRIGILFRLRDLPHFLRSGV